MVNRVLGHLRRRLRFVTEILPAKLLVKSNVAISQTDLARAIADTKIERDWFGRVAPYHTYQQIAASVAAGQLVKVSAGRDFLPTLRFRNPKLHEHYPPYLTP